jgi:hypothetical protein
MTTAVLPDPDFSCNEGGLNDCRFVAGVRENANEVLALPESGIANCTGLGAKFRYGTLLCVRAPMISVRCGTSEG